MKKTKRNIGPVQLLAIGFEPNFEINGKILEEFQKLEDSGTLRIIDLLFVKKEEDNSGLIALSIQGEELGSVVGALLGFEFEGDETNHQDNETVSANKNAFGVSQEDIENLGKSLQPGSAAAILLVEHMWARDLKKAIRNAGGHPLAEGFLTPEAIAVIGTELAVLTDQMDKLQEQSGHTRQQLTN